MGFMDDISDRGREPAGSLSKQQDCFVKSVVLWLCKGEEASGRGFKIQGLKPLA
jgi:hypothetical protein